VPPIYDLFAVSNHSGGLGGGHYTAYGKNFRTGKWYMFNDSSTHEVNPEEVVTRSAYVLFYRRRSPGGGGGGGGGGAGGRK
jgi:ubiquitin carboxyl-terminal hydrolase 4/11